VARSAGIEQKRPFQRRARFDWRSNGITDDTDLNGRTAGLLLSGSRWRAPAHHSFDSRPQILFLAAARGCVRQGSGSFRFIRAIRARAVGAPLEGWIWSEGGSDPFRVIAIPDPRSVVRDANRTPRSVELRQPESYGPSWRGVVLSLGSGARMLAMRRPATSETAVSTIVNAVAIPVTVSRSINDDMLR
jgi:hypothetical protein